MAVLTSIGIIEKGESCLSETVYDGTGYLQLENSVLPNAGGQVYGEIGFKQAFMDSVNVYFAKKAIEDVGKARMDELAERCSIGTPQYFDFGMMLSKYDFNNTNTGQNLKYTARHTRMKHRISLTVKGILHNVFPGCCVMICRRISCQKLRHIKGRCIGPCQHTSCLCFQNNNRAFIRVCRAVYLRF